MQSHSKKHCLCISSHPLRTLHRDFPGQTQGEEPHPENSTPECLFQCSETTGLRGPRKTNSRKPSHLPAQTRVKKTFTQPRLTPCGPGTRSRSGWKWSRSPTDGTSCRGRRSPPAAGSGACSSASTPGHALWEMEDAVTGRAPASSQEKQLQGLVWVGPWGPPSPCAFERPE